jgi:trimeric autotransporter adhesin
MKTTQLMLLAVIFFASSALAVDPPPDGGYINQNTAEGQDALFNLNVDMEEGAYDNTAVGFNALYNDTDGVANTAIGTFALYGNITGGSNTANGDRALAFNTTGNGNTASGVLALYSNTIGNDNLANGNVALTSNTQGSSNTANGVGALSRNTTGSANVALGVDAGSNLTTGSNNIDIGNAGVAGESRTIRIGTTRTQSKTYIAGISGVAVPAGVGVIVGTDGKLGTVVSSERFKNRIKPMEKVSEAILALKPVTFRYKKELDPDGVPQFGLVAEDVAKVNPNLVARDEQGKPYTVRYDAVNAMLLNEFLKAHSKIEEQGKEIVELKAALKQQAAQLEKVSSRLEARDLKDRWVDNR